MARSKQSQQRRQRKQQKKKRREQKRPSRPSLSHSQSAYLAAADEAMGKSDWGEAIAILTELTGKHPKLAPAWAKLGEAAYQSGDMDLHEWAMHHSYRLCPDEIGAVLAAAGAYFTNARPGLAYKTFRVALSRWPDHPLTAELDGMLVSLREALEECIESWPSLPPDFEGRVELSAVHDEIHLCTTNGKWQKVVDLATRLLVRYPDFTPAINNLAEAQFQLGQTSEAIAGARRTLACEADNFFTLSNLARYLLMSGDLEQARQIAARLRTVESSRPDIWVKKAEIWSMLGDDQQIDALYRRERQEHVDMPAESRVRFLHLTAVAAMRLGDERSARKRWRKAEKVDPHFQAVSKNLAELDGPEETRHAPWALSFDHWCPPRVFDAFRRFQLEEMDLEADDLTTHRFKQLLGRYPEILTLVPYMLDRGDGPTRSFAMLLAQDNKSEAMTTALRDFALSQRGPDAVRQRALNILTDWGAVPSGPIRFWIKNEWRDVLTFGWEIHREQMSDHPEEVQRLADEGHAALQEGDGRRAEALYRQALRLRPEAPDLRNNLATALLMQGLDDEADELHRELYRNHPDYFFGIVAAADRDRRNGDVEAAREKGLMLMRRKRMHVSELAALAQLQIVLCLDDDKPDAAQMWIDQLKEVDPDHPLVDGWENRRRGPGRLLGG